MTGRAPGGSFAAARSRVQGPRAETAGRIRVVPDDDDQAEIASRVSATADRAASGIGRKPAAPPGILLIEQFLIARRWYDMAPVLGLNALLVWACFARAPSPLAAICIGLAIIVVAASRTFVHFERTARLPFVQRVLVLWGGIGLPMALYGSGVTDWALRAEPEIGQIGLVGGLTMTTMFAGILLSGRLTSFVATVVALWIPPALASGSPLALAALGCTAAGGALMIRRLKHVHGEMLAQQRHDEQERVRALDILIDYERTGPGWFWETDDRGGLTYVSPKIAEILGKGNGELVGQPLAGVFLHKHEDGEGIQLLEGCLASGTPFHELALRASTVGGECWWSVSGRPIHGPGGEFAGFRGFGFDLTERRRYEERAARLAHFDSLTGLANRFQMSQKLEGIVRAQQADKRVCGVLLLDLDRFKQVNDTLGHPAGDTLLRQVAERLERAVDRAGRVGRLGGDEFQVILPGMADRAGLAEVSERIIDSISQPYVIEGQRVVIGASVGIAVSPEDGLSSDALIRNADLALYAAKDRGRGRYHFYAPDLHSDAEERRQLEHDLRDAIANAGLELYYQPIVHTATERITGFEALLRWNHPALGPLSPAKFVPIAEDAGLIGTIGEWALRTACHDLSRWPESIRVAVNVSALQFSNPALPAIVTSALAEAQVSPSRLELEITESVFMTDDEGLDTIFAALKGIGVRLALDDFGTGYSSLGYLKKAPFDKIKIDQSFVRGATVKGSRNGAIIASIVSLAEALGMETTAEGVETLDELDLVRVLGCSHIQGFIYEAPLSAEGAGDRLQSGLVAIAQGPRGKKARQHTRSRRVAIHHAGERHVGRIHNFSAVGAMVEAPPLLPIDAEVRIELLSGESVMATVRWCEEGRMGVEFIEPFDMARALQKPPAAEGRGAGGAQTGHPAARPPRAGRG